MPPGEVGNVLEPVLPAAGEAVNEQERWPLAHLDVVCLGPDDVHLVAVLPPVDPQPLRVGVAVGVRTVRRSRRRQLDLAPREFHGEGCIRGDAAELVANGVVGISAALRLVGNREIGVAGAHAYPIRSRIGISRIWRLGTEAATQARNVPIGPGCFRLFWCLTGEQLANSPASSGNVRGPCDDPRGSTSYFPPLPPGRSRP